MSAPRKRLIGLTSAAVPVPAAPAARVVARHVGLISSALNGNDPGEPRAGRADVCACRSMASAYRVEPS